MRKVLYVLGSLTDEDVGWIASNGRKESLRPGTVIIHDGKVPDSLFILLDGKLKVTAGGAAEKLLAVLGTGEIVGELSYIDARPATATVSVLEPSIVLRLPRTEVSAKLAEDLGFAARFYRALAVFLADRLRRSTTAQVAATSGRALQADVIAEDEIDPELLDSLALAGKRFEWMLERLKVSR